MCPATQTFLFQVDANDGVTPEFVFFKQDVSTWSSILPDMILAPEVEYELQFRGPASSAINVTTDAPTRPGIPPPPVLSYATGGALNVRVFSPNDTGASMMTKRWRIDEQTNA